MSATHPSSLRHSSRSRALAKHWLALLPVVMLATACAGGTIQGPSTPDESVLVPAEQALARARAAQADTFAPRVVDASRRRIATARDILYGAARARRPLNGGEQGRVDRLVAAAELDARSALVQTQAKAVQSKLGELQGGTGAADSGMKATPNPPMGQAGGTP